ncbi:MAG: ATP phosphoribosyltransferase [Microthrixaceae bacterium]
MPTSEPSPPGQPLKVALPNKGALSEEAAELLGEAGYRVGRSSKALRVFDRAENVEFLFLRPRDIAIYVGSGVIDLGITGRDLTTDSGAPVVEVLPLGFGRAEFRIAAPVGSGFELADGARIATSYEGLLGRYLAERGVDAEIIHLDGAVELAPSLGVADAVADVVQSGRTLAEAGLEVVGDCLLASEAVLICGQGRTPVGPARVMVERMRGVVVAASYLMVEYDLPEALLARATELAPGMEGVTVAPLSRQGWVGIRVMVPSAQANAVMDDLAELGAKAILATELRTCRL